MRSRSRARHGAALFLVAALATVAACGGNKPTKATGPEATTTSVPTKSAETIKEGGEIKIGIEARPESLDPFTSSAINTSSWQYANDAIYDSLVYRSPVDGRLENRLAEKLTPNADFTVWTITLRKDVKFTDGTPLDADVVVANLTYRSDPAKCRCSANFEPLTSKVVDANTLTITSKAPDAHLPDPKLTVPILAKSLLDPAAAEARDRKPVGTGPFKLVDRDQFTFEKNPNYWRTDDRGRKLPHLDKLQLVPIQDGTVRLAALDKGEIDMMESYDGATITAAKKDTGVKTQTSAGAGSTVAILNATKPPFDDPRARLAAAKAINREALAQSLPGQELQPAYSFLGKDSPFKVTGTFPATDIAGAKQLVSDVVKEKGAAYGKIDLVCVNIPDSKALMPIVINSLKEIGFDPTLRLLDIGEYAATLLNGNKNFNLACTRANSFAADPAGISTFVYSNGPANVAGYKNPEMDKLFDQDKVTIDPAERLKIFQKVNDLVIKDLPYIPLLVNTAAIVSRPGVVEGIATPTPEWAAEVDTAWLWRAKG